MTPEGKVKKRVREVLNRLGCYYAMPVTGGFGNSGVPDFLACVSGRFYGIECKAQGKQPTALQRDHLRRIAESGGIPLLIDETNVDQLEQLITLRRSKHDDQA